MTLQAGQTAIQDYLDGIRKATVLFKQSLSDAPYQTVDLEQLSGYATKVRKIQSHIIKEHDSDVARSRIIDRFFEQWNNMVFGVFYINDIYTSHGSVTEQQYAILTAAIDEILTYTERFA